MVSYPTSRVIILTTKDYHCGTVDREGKCYLILRGEKKQRWEDHSIQSNDRCYGTFEKSFLLPHGTPNFPITQTLENGVLEVTIPKVAFLEDDGPDISYLSSIFDAQVCLFLHLHL